MSCIFEPARAVSKIGSSLKSNHQIKLSLSESLIRPVVVKIVSVLCANQETLIADNQIEQNSFFLFINKKVSFAAKFSFFELFKSVNGVNADIDRDISY